MLRYVLQAFRIRIHRQNALATLKIDSGLVKFASGNGWRTPAPGATTYTPAATIQFQNLYRDGGSDGLSAISYFVDLPRANGTPNYTAEFYGPPPLIDFQDDQYYPNDRYPNF